MLSKSPQVVKLNVGGKLFSTTQQTLLLHNSTFFSSLINNSAKDDDCEFFIDRDPKMFSVILNYLRSNDLVSESHNVDFTALKYEAMFYQLNSLILKINLISFGYFNYCGNILFQGGIDFTESGNNVGIKNVSSVLFNQNGELPSRSNVVLSGHRPSNSVDLSRLGSVDDFFNDTSLTSQRLSSPINLRASSHIEPIHDKNEIMKDENRLNKSKSLEFTYVEGHPLNSQVTIIKCHQKWMAVCYPFSVHLYWHCDINGWRSVWHSDPTKSCGIIHKIALMSKPPQIRRNTASLARRDSTVVDDTNNLIHEALIAIACGGQVSLYNILLNVVVKTPVDYNVIPLQLSVTFDKLSQFSFDNPIDYLVFLGGHLLAISESYPTFGFWQRQSRRWHNCSVNALINCYSVMSDEFIILGCENGGIYQLNAQKFPLRMSDNAVLYTEMFRDPSNDSVTALDVFYNSQKCCSLVSNCLEIAYGTVSGKIRIVVQHAGVGEGPKIFQTLTVHRAKIIRIVISEKYLISICQNMNHIRSWLICRFRGTIYTQPGTQSLASFHLMSLDIEPKINRTVLDNVTLGPISEITNEDMIFYNQVQKIIRMNTDMGPYTDHLLFIQKLLPQCDRLFVRLAHTGKRVCIILSDKEAITAFAIHQSDIGGTVNLITGHEDGSLEVWNLTTSIDQMGNFEIHHPPTAAASILSGHGSHCLREVGDNNEQNKVLMGFTIYPSLDEPSENGPTPRELFFMLRDYDISLDDTSDKSIKLTHCISYQSLHSEVSSKNSTIQRLHRSNQSKFKN